MDVPPLGVPPSKNDSILSRNTFGRDMAQAKGTLQPFAHHGSGAPATENGHNRPLSAWLIIKGFISVFP